MNYRLGIKSDFSIGKSLLTVDKIVAGVKEAGFDAIAVTDDMTISAMPILSNKLKGIAKTVFGVTLYVHEDATYKPPTKSSGIAPKDNPMFTLKVYAKSEKGIQSIYKLLTLANTESHFYYNARTQMSEVLQLEDVIVTTGDFFNLFSVDNYKEHLLSLISKFGIENVLIEIVPINSPLYERCFQRAIHCWHVYDKRCKAICTLPALYEKDEDIDSLNVYQAVAKNMQITAEKGAVLKIQKIKGLTLNQKWNDIKNNLFGKLVDKYWEEGHGSVGNLAEFTYQCFAESPKYLFDNCSYEFKKKAPCLPKMADDEFKAVVEECKKGWRKRFAKPVLGYLPSKEQMPEYMNRVKYELSILQKMGFSGYFLLVQDLVKWSKDNGIIVGPGRGSVGGSLVAYLMGITEVDPIRFNLFFERFINPERHDLPDADLDYQSTRRQEVIEYLEGKYGKECVSGISNYGALGSASAIRDAGRIFSLPMSKLEVSKMVPKEHGFSSNLEESAKLVPEIGYFAKENPKLWRHSLALEGVMRSLGRHAAGTIVAGEPLVKRAVVERRAGSSVVNWDKRIVEDMGLIKMDILGLSTLDTLQICLKYIEKRYGKKLNLLDISLDDKETLQAFGRGETTGVFQFESSGMKQLLKSLAYGGQLTFEDITTATALYRPGPMDSGLLDDFVKIKQGYKSIFYDHPNMESALKETCGIMVYQEQVMQVARDLAGFSMGEADNLRKAMGKKDLEKMATMKEKFIEGAFKVSAMSKEQARELFEKIEKFASYGFNKSHSVEYSIISYWSCYLRTHYPAEYFASALSIISDEKFEPVVKDAQEAGIAVLPPQINHSSAQFEVLDEHRILAPFSSVKYISTNIANKIVKLREKNGGSFSSIEEFKTLASKKGSGVNTRAVSNLEKVGSFCEIDSTIPPVDDPSRIKDQKELMGGLILQVVRNPKTVIINKVMKDNIVSIIDDVGKCTECDLCEKVHCSPSFGSKEVKFMIVGDCPSWEEENKGKFMTGKVGGIVQKALASAGLSYKNGYYTALVKAKKEGKFLTGEQVAKCSKFLEKEIQAINPAVVVALGSTTIRKFFPDMKASEADGQAIYDPAKNMTIVCGINPAQVLFDEEKMNNLISTFNKVKDVVL